jgi:hypothetical protein
MPNLKAREDRVRRKAALCGYRVCKSRKTKHLSNLDNPGRKYMLLRTSGNYVVLGSWYDATLDDIEAFLPK